jgi:hypothetical protein
MEGNEGSASSKAVSAQRAAELGPLPVLASESPDAYLRLYEEFVAAIAPEDVVVRSEVKCIVDNTWEINRLTRAKAAIIDCAKKEALASLLRSILPEAAIKTSREQDARQLADGWFTGPSTEVVVGELLSEHGLKADHIGAEAVRLRSRELDQLERMLALKEARRSNAYRNIEIYREARRLRDQRTAKPTQNLLPYLPRKDGKEQAKAG